MKNRNKIAIGSMSMIALIIAICITSCSKETCSTPDCLGINVEELMNDTIILPAGSFQIDESEVTIDNSINVTGTSNSLDRLQPGNVIDVSVDFNAGNSNITYAGIRFGADGPISLIPISGANGQSNGTLTFPLQFPEALCSEVSQLCHSVSQYTFAASQNGDNWNISNAKINDAVLGCATCEEPSCKELIPACDCDVDAYLITYDEYIDSLDELETDDEYCNFKDEFLVWYADFVNCVYSSQTQEERDEIIQVETVYYDDLFSIYGC